MALSAYDAACPLNELDAELYLLVPAATEQLCLPYVERDRIKTTLKDHSAKFTANFGPAVDIRQAEFLNKYFPQFLDNLKIKYFPGKT
jgi:hypothetical protein